MTSGISFHVLYDGIDSDPNPLRVALASLQPRVINIVGGARKTQAFTFAIEIKKKYPNMRVIFRNWPDDGIHAIDKYKLVTHRDAFGNLIVDDFSGCQRWLDDNQNYLLAGLTVLTDNESMRADLDVYSEWQAKIMDLAGAKGWSVAVGRFSTGNPPKAQLPQLEKMFRTLFKWGDLHCFSPNEYFSKDPTRNGGNIYRYADATAYAKSIGAWPFPVNIGEFGLLVMDAGGRLDPYAGFKDSKVGLGGAASASFTIAQWKAWYKNEGVDVCLFCWGGDGTPKWERCRIDNDDAFLKILLAAAAYGELEPMTTTPPTAIPSTVPAYQPDTFTAGMSYRLKTPGSFINIRTSPTGDVVGQVDDGSIIVVYEEQKALSEFWRRITVGDLNGWISMQGGNVHLNPYLPSVTPPVISDPVQIPTPVIVDVPTTNPTPTIWSRIYAAQLKVAQAHLELAQLYRELDSENQVNKAA